VITIPASHAIAIARSPNEVSTRPRVNVRPVVPMTLTFSVGRAGPEASAGVEGGATGVDGGAGNVTAGPSGVRLGSCGSGTAGVQIVM